MISKGIEQRLNEIFSPPQVAIAKGIFNYLKREQIKNPPHGFKGIPKTSIQRATTNNAEEFEIVFNTLQSMGYIQEKRGEHYFLGTQFHNRRYH